MKRILLSSLFLILCSFNGTNSLYNGLVAHYRFLEGSGLQFVDRRNLVKSSAASGVVWKQTERGKLPYFDKATSTHITLSKNTFSDMASKAMTVSCWVKMEVVTGTYHYFVSDLSAGGNDTQFSLGYTNTNVFRMFWLNAGAGTIVNGVGTPVANLWYHVVGTRSGVSGAWVGTLYVNGIQQASTSIATNPPSQATGGTFTIGRPGSYTGCGNCQLQGYVDEVMIWDRALSHSEVRALNVEQRNYFKN